MYCIEALNLSYSFTNTQRVLKNINIKVPGRSVYGFLGPNGAGKTTTLKLILGLIRKQAGSIKIFDKSFSENRIEILKSIGSLIESPSVYAHLSAKDNLKIFQKIYQCNETSIAEKLSIVGLSNTGSKRAGQFSLGMKQRLSIAIALLNNPSLLILDEPTNGLDPNGIIEMREMLVKLNKDYGVTLLVSSHLLSEIDKLATHVGLIHNGEMLFEGSMQQLKAGQLKNAAVVFKTSDPIKAAAILTDRNIKTTIIDGDVIIGFEPKETVAMLTRLIVLSEIDLYEVVIKKDDLETIFMQTINQ